jgi:hypothetical protein
MRNHTNLTKRLRLTTETLRHLNVDELEHVVGGQADASGSYVLCPSYQGNCPSALGYCPTAKC